MSVFEGGTIVDTDKNCEWYKLTSCRGWYKSGSGCRNLNLKVEEMFTWNQ